MNCLTFIFKVKLHGGDGEVVSQQAVGEGVEERPRVGRAQLQLSLDLRPPLWRLQAHAQNLTADLLHTESELVS